MATARTERDSARKLVATNRKAFRDYEVLERIEAGLALRGTEVKALRGGDISLTGAFAQVDGTQVLLQGLHISPYRHGNRFNHDPTRARRLLLHRREIRRLIGQVAEKGRTLIPLRVYFRRGYAKVELGLCRGKHTSDKRETLKRKTAEREARRALSGARR